MIQRHIVWSGASPLNVEKRDCQAAAASDDTSTTSSQESLWASVAHPNWRPTAPSFPTASLPAGITVTHQVMFHINIQMGRKRMSKFWSQLHWMSAFWEENSVSEEGSCKPGRHTKFFWKLFIKWQSLLTEITKGKTLSSNTEGKRTLKSKNFSHASSFYT